MFNYLDVLILLLIVYLICQGYRTGFLGGLFNVLTTIISFVLAALIYPSVGHLLTSKFSIGDNFANVFGFLGTLVVLEIIFGIIFSFIYSKFTPLYKKHKTLREFDRYLGIIPSLGIGLFLITVLMLLILSLPVKSWLRSPIENSWWGRNVATQGYGFVPTIEKYLGRLPYKNLVYIITPKGPMSEESQKLNISQNAQFKEDPESEKGMFELVNKERTDRGLLALKFSNALRAVGRAHCLDMFKRSYFSHYTPEGKSPFDRIEAAGINYLAAGENLAYAPSLSIAHQGLMNSPGHKANILRDSFGTIGVGVIDGGLNGKMFCQEFTN